MDRIIGVVSDTHGLLRESVRKKLMQCEMIIHAGDIGGNHILQDLQRIAKVVAVRGNVDRDYRAARLNSTEFIDIAGHNIYVLHNIDELDLNPAAAKLAAVLYGHSHRPSITHRNGVLYLNPGSAGPRRFNLPVSMAYIRIVGDRLVPEIVALDE